MTIKYVLFKQTNIIEDKALQVYYIDKTLYNNNDFKYMNYTITIPDGIYNAEAINLHIQKMLKEII